jgi:hypothetical protein
VESAGNSSQTDGDRSVASVKMSFVRASEAERLDYAKRHLKEQFAAGEIITDMSQKEWKLGVPIGQGGFGCLSVSC